MAGRSGVEMVSQSKPHFHRPKLTPETYSLRVFIIHFSFIVRSLTLSLPHSLFLFRSSFLAFFLSLSLPPSPSPPSLHVCAHKRPSLILHSSAGRQLGVYSAAILSILLSPFSMLRREPHQPTANDQGPRTIEHRPKASRKLGWSDRTGFADQISPRFLVRFDRSADRQPT
ncbi:unnamed protein product [Protopolystoma xenopodis]|uniref:Uncharacterized protein n=1 Tax=Protopolystoma xenopodis TaxID=117903 RepID=A0A3S5FDI1_9PLAT|nr:unnamed protein product [Protopolystoma xenopodis]